VGLETLAFVDCSESGRFEAEIQADVDDAAAIGLTGTPSFVVGRTIPQGLEGTRIVGAQPFAVFDARIKALLLAPE
jgi:predicted DsbA family dithiol-disulfide isomerase